MTNSPLTPFIVIGAVIIVTIDTITWLLWIFAISGPILVSGVYEAFLDNILLEYVQNNIDTGALSTASRARVLYTILVGNLDMTDTSNGEDPGNSAWNHINADDADPNHPENDSLLRELSLPHHARPDADRTKTRLRTMLASQYSFGVTIGAPVVFFCASFFYNLIDNYSNLGDNDTSMALGESSLIWSSMQLIDHPQHLGCGG